VRAIILSHLYLDPDRRGKLRALAGMGVSLTVAVPGGNSTEDHGVRLASIPAKGNPKDPDCVWNRTALRALIADRRPDLIQVEEEPWSLIGTRATAEAARLKVPVIFCCQEPRRPDGFFARRRARRSLRSVRGAIAGNALAVEHLRGSLPGIPVIELPQFGVTLPPPSDRAPREVLSLGYIGRLLPDRGVDRLLRACATLLGGWNLTVAGTGPEQESLELLAQRLGLASRVRWLGGVTRGDVESLWKDIEVLVIPADPASDGAERWAAILVDAMARGVIPVVMEGGIPASLVGEAGKQARDDEALEVILQTLRAYPADRARLAAAARQRVLDHFVDAALATGTLRFWERILEESVR
jgi:glycosyltransferase involved in cell wall biosynthesis